MQQIQDVQLCDSEKHVGADDPRHALQENGGMVDLWYIDSDEILCHPVLVLSYLQALDAANVKKLKHSVTHRRQKSFLICQTWTQLRQTGE